MIIFGGNNTKGIIVYGIVSLVILAFTYFVIIKPATDNANDAVDRGFDQALNQQTDIQNQITDALETNAADSGNVQDQIDAAQAQADQAIKDAGGSSANAQELQQSIQDQVDQALNQAGVSK